MHYSSTLEREWRYPLSFRFNISSSFFETVNDLIRFWVSASVPQLLHNRKPKLLCTKHWVEVIDFLWTQIFHWGFLGVPTLELFTAWIDVIIQFPDSTDSSSYTTHATLQSNTCRFFSAAIDYISRRIQYLEKCFQAFNCDTASSFLLWFCMMCILQSSCSGIISN